MSGQSPTRTEGWVVLPVEDYRALRRAAFPEDREPEPPPVDVTLTRVDYDLKVEGEVATGDARLTIDVIKEGWVRVPIPAGLLVREARLDGKLVSLVTPPADKGTGTPYLVLSRPGRTVITLNIVARISSVAATEMLQLPTGISAVSRATVVLPRQGFDVRVSGGLLLDKSETLAESRWIACGRGNELLTFSWRRKVEDQRATLPLRLRGTITQLVGLGEDITHITAEVQVEVLQGLAREVRIRLPEQLTVNQVSGATVANWNAAPKELSVTFLEPVEGTTRFTVSAETKLAREGQLDVPLLRLSSVEREAGGLAIEVLGAGEIKERDARGFDEADATELGQLISSRQSPSLVAFRMRPGDANTNRALSIRVARYATQAVLTANVEEARYSMLVSDEGKLLVHSRFAVRNNQRSFLKLTLPAGASLWSAAVSGKPVRPGRAPDGSFLIPLEKGRAGEEAPVFAVETVYLERLPAWTDKGRARLSLVAVDMPISRSSVMVRHSPAFRVTAAPGTFRVQPYQPPSSSVLARAASEPEAVRPSAPGRNEMTEALASRIQGQAGAIRTSRNLPVRVTVPAFGPLLFLVSELTSEGQHPVLEFDFQRERKRGE